MYEILDIDQIVFELTSDEALRAAEARLSELPLLQRSDNAIVAMLAEIANELLASAIDDYRKMGEVHIGLYIDHIGPYTHLMMHHFYRYLPEESPEPNECA